MKRTVGALQKLNSPDLHLGAVRHAHHVETTSEGGLHGELNSSGLFPGQRHRKAAAFTDLAFDGDRAVVQIDEMPGQC